MNEWRMNKEWVETVRRETNTLISCEDDFLLMKRAVDELYRVFSAITGVTINQLNTESDIMLPSGKAIGMAGAAHCLLELKRTAVFLRGINKAILSKKKAHIALPLRVLYAGTGPYGTLVVPLLTLLTPKDIIVDLLEINEKSLTCVQKVIDCLDLNAYIGEVYCADATTFSVNHSYDIVISETMLACLKSEPQVAIMQNLIPQLSSGAIFIPEEISIDVSLTNPRMEQERLLYFTGEKPPFSRISLGNVFKVHKNSLDVNQMRKLIGIPEGVEEYPVLRLFTTVRVFENEILSENDSSITLPKTYCDLRTQHIKEIEFWYKQGAKPEIECRKSVYDVVI
jgi:predicted RNA methylase